MNISISDLTAMKKRRYQPVDKKSLIDLRDVAVNQSLPVPEKTIEFIRQIGNPYLFRYGDKIVRISFVDSKTTFEDKIRGYFEML